MSLMFDEMMTNAVVGKVELLSVRGEVQTWVTDCKTMKEAEATLTAWGYKKQTNGSWAK